MRMPNILNASQQTSISYSQRGEGNKIKGKAGNVSNGAPKTISSSHSFV
jgi:hypothetical protein